VKETIIGIGTEIYEYGKTSNTVNHEWLDNNDTTVQKLFNAYTSYRIMSNFVSSQNTVYLSDLTNK